jgi:hypothetical protein
MPERIVSDLERVVATLSLWRSRFNKGASPSEIARHTGLPINRVQEALGKLQSPAPSPLVRIAPAKPITAQDTVELLTCQDCKRTFRHTRRRGRKPSRCGDCRP